MLALRAEVGRAVGVDPAGAGLEADAGAVGEPVLVDRGGDERAVVELSASSPG
jgi:hypothetical protein